MTVTASFEHTTEVASGDWIAPRLLGAFGAVGRVCPTGYEAYARIFHPVGEARAAWADVCAETGRAPHALMQWHDVSRPVDAAGQEPWREPPPTGTLGAESLAVLAAAVVGGSRLLVERVLSSGLEAAEVTAASDLSSEGDRINR